MAAGIAEAVPVPSDEVMERLLENLEPEPGTGCWVWKRSIVGGRRSNLGGGSFHNQEEGYETGDRKTFLAHRLMYAFEFGDIPAEHAVRRTCRNNRCCEPTHLKLVLWDGKSQSRRKGAHH